MFQEGLCQTKINVIIVHIISNGNRTEWSTNYSVSNSVCDFKSAEHVVQGRFESASTITPELNHTKSCYQL